MNFDFYWSKLLSARWILQMKQQYLVDLEKNWINGPNKKRPKSLHNKKNLTIESDRAEPIQG